MLRRRSDRVSNTTLLDVELGNSVAPPELAKREFGVFKSGHGGTAPSNCAFGVTLLRNHLLELAGEIDACLADTPNA